MDSDSEADMFLTQSTFRDEPIDSDSDELSLLFREENKATTKYQPIVSDISDEELIAALDKVEKMEKQKQPSCSNSSNSTRFAKPINDAEMENISRRR